MEAVGAERPHPTSSPSDCRGRSGGGERVAGRSRGGGSCLGSAGGRDGVPPRVEGKKGGQMAKSGSLKSQHLAECLSSHRINQRRRQVLALARSLTQLSSAQLSSSCAWRPQRHLIYSGNNCPKTFSSTKHVPPQTHTTHLVAVLGFICGL